MNHVEVLDLADRSAEDIRAWLHDKLNLYPNCDWTFEEVFGFLIVVISPQTKLETNAGFLR